VPSAARSRTSSGSFWLCFQAPSTRATLSVIGMIIAMNFTSVAGVILAVVQGISSARRSSNEADKSSRCARKPCRAATVSNPRRCTSTQFHVGT